MMPAESLNFARSSTPPHEDHDEFSDSVQSHDPMDKDQTELELEKLVFGDESGFRDALREHSRRKSNSTWGDDYDQDEKGLSGSENGDEHDLEQVQDAELFFLDTEPSASDRHTQLPSAVTTKDDVASSHQRPPAWEDSDDERMLVSLANTPRLRKLRVTEGEDLVDGKEYTKRLRRQFELLYPVPDWALPSSKTRKSVKRLSKRRRLDPDATSSSGESDSNSEGDEMESDSGEGLSAQPLAKILQSSAGFTRALVGKGGRRKLKPEVIDIQRSKDVGANQPSAVTSLSFHPYYPILLIQAGPASLISLHHVHTTAHPTPNPLITSLHIPHTPLTSTAFLQPSGSQVFLSGRRRYYHAWDLSSGVITKVSRLYGHQGKKDGVEQRSFEMFRLSPCGRWMAMLGTSRKGGGGIINVLDAHTNQWIAQARLDGHGGIAELDWWKDGEGFTVVSRSGDVGEWYFAQRRFVAKWKDEGGVGITTIALGGSNSASLGNSAWVAIGSASGIVNIYDRRSWTSAQLIPPTPSPKRSVSNLKTPVSSLLFSPCGQVLAMSSRWKKDALRLVHIPSCTVYRNWPTSATGLGRVTAMEFSPEGDGDDGMKLALGNEAGRTRIWEIRG